MKENRPGALAAALVDPSAEVRVNAALALAAGGDRRAAQPLLAGLSDAHPLAAQAAHVALEQLTGHTVAFDSFADAAARQGSAVCQCVGRLASTLKPEYAQALRRIEIDGVAVKDYAAEAGISGSSAGVRGFRARPALRRQVGACCGARAEHGCLDCTCTAPPGAPTDGA